MKTIMNLKFAVMALCASLLISACGTSKSTAVSVIAIYCKATQIKDNNDIGIITFLDGNCIGVGSYNKGLFTSLPQDEYSRDTHTLSLYSISARGVFTLLFSSPINFSLKNYYLFEWNKNKIVMSN